MADNKGLLSRYIDIRNEHIKKGRRYGQYTEQLSHAIGANYVVKDKSVSNSVMSGLSIYDYYHNEELGIGKKINRGTKLNPLTYEVFSNNNSGIKPYSDSDDYLSYIERTYGQKPVILQNLETFLSLNEMEFAMRLNETGVIRTFNVPLTLGGMISTNPHGINDDTRLGRISNFFFSRNLREGAYYNTTRGRLDKVPYITPSLFKQYGNNTANLSRLSDILYIDSRYGRTRDDLGISVTIQDLSEADGSDNTGLMYLKEQFENAEAYLNERHKDENGNIRTIYADGDFGTPYVNTTDNVKQLFDGGLTVYGRDSKTHYEYGEGENHEGDFYGDIFNSSEFDDSGAKNNILSKTAKLFKEHKIGTFISRMTDMGSDFIEAYHNGETDNGVGRSTDGKVVGHSHGRALLKKKYSTVEGSDPFCRNWSYHKQYATLSDAIRPFSNEEGFYSIYKIQKFTSNPFRTKIENEPMIDGSKYLAERTVLQDNGVVRITPTTSNNNTSKCMFSIENLAWKDVKITHHLSPEQRGPNGGRIMWFPPYDLEFSENVNVNWESNSFIGRGEKVHTYTNTDRTGSISFALLIDHPVVANSLAKLKNGQGSGVNDDIEGDILRYFAGCDIPDGLEKINIDADGNGVIDDPNEKEPSLNDAEDVANNMDDCISFAVHFPNNYSGTDNTENWWKYLLIGNDIDIPEKVEGEDYKDIETDIEGEEGGKIIIKYEEKPLEQRSTIDYDINKNEYVINLELTEDEIGDDNKINVELINQLVRIYEENKKEWPSIDLENVKSFLNEHLNKVKQESSESKQSYVRKEFEATNEVQDVFIIEKCEYELDAKKTLGKLKEISEILSKKSDFDNNEKIQEEYAERGSIRLEIEETKNDINKFESELETLSKTIDSINADIEKYKKLKEGTDSGTNKAYYDEQIENKNISLNSYTEKVKNKKLTIKEANNYLKDLEKRRDKLDKELKDFDDSLNNSDSDISNLVNEIKKDGFEGKLIYTATQYKLVEDEDKARNELDIDAAEKAKVLDNFQKTYKDYMDILEKYFDIDQKDIVESLLKRNDFVQREIKKEIKKVDMLINLTYWVKDYHFEPESIGYEMSNDFKGISVLRHGLPNKNGKIFYYRVDNDLLDPMLENDENYKDKQSFAYNSKTKAFSNTNCTFAEFMLSIIDKLEKDPKETSLISDFIKEKTGTTDDRVKEIRNRLDSSNKLKLDILSYATSHGEKTDERNGDEKHTDTLSEKRGNTIKNLLTYCYNNIEPSEVRSDVYDLGDNMDVSSSDAKKYRSAIVTIYLNDNGLSNDEGDVDALANNANDFDNGTRVNKDIESSSNRYDNEYRFFKDLDKNDPLLFKNIKDKFEHFDPAFHSMSPEGFNARLNFLQQCTRQGHTVSASEVTNGNWSGTAGNLSFGRMPVCVVRIGDFIYHRMIINSLQIQYSSSGGLVWDLNPEGSGVQPMYAKITLGVILLGGASLNGPINRLQNAQTFDYYANTGVYDDRADFLSNDGQTFKHIFTPNINKESDDN